MALTKPKIQASHTQKNCQLSVPWWEEPAMCIRVLSGRCCLLCGGTCRARGWEQRLGRRVTVWRCMMSDGNCITRMSVVAEHSKSSNIEPIVIATRDVPRFRSLRRRCMDVLFLLRWVDWLVLWLRPNMTSPRLLCIHAVCLHVGCQSCWLLAVVHACWFILEAHSNACVVHTGWALVSSQLFSQKSVIFITHHLTSLCLNLLH